MNKLISKQKDSKDSMQITKHTDKHNSHFNFYSSRIYLRIFENH